MTNISKAISIFIVLIITPLLSATLAYIMTEQWGAIPITFTLAFLLAIFLIKQGAFDTFDEKEMKAEIKAMQDKADKLGPLDCGRGIYGTRIEVLRWVLGQTDEKPSEHQP